MKRNSILIFIAIFVVVSYSSLGLAQPPNFKLKNKQFLVQDFAPDEVIVKFKDSVKEDAIGQLFGKLKLKKIRKNMRLKFHRMKIRRGKSVFQMIQELKKNPLVEYAEPNYVFHAHYTPNDYYYDYQWNFRDINQGGTNVNKAWDKTKGDSSVIVAVLDTGVGYEDYEERVSSFRTDVFSKAPDFENTEFKPGYDFVNNDEHSNDDYGHGTHVAGTIAQSTNNFEGVAGIAFRTTIMPIKVINYRGYGFSSDIADGITYAADNGAKIVNMSFGSTFNSSTLRNACKYAYEHDVTLVCSSGNDGSTRNNYPAAYDDYCISVGATRMDDSRAPYSNYGATLDLVAPGGDLEEDWNNDGVPDGILQQTFDGDPNNWGYFLAQGTSMAAPHVSGIAALVIANGVASTPDEIRAVLQNTAKDLGDPGYDQEYGWGKVDAYRAVTYDGGGTEPPPPLPVNQAPIAEISGPDSGDEREMLGYSSAGSSDPDGDALTYRWNFGDGVETAVPNPSHAYQSAGTFKVTLIVNDGQVDSEEAVKWVTIAEVNDPPEANAGNGYSGFVGIPVNFDGSGSSDPENRPLDYDWDFGDGNFGTGEKPQHTYLADGTYPVVLTVTDDGGLMDADETDATITIASNEVEVFYDSFESGEWNNKWMEDSQRDWSRSWLRSTDARYSADVDGKTLDGGLISMPINLQGYNRARITFDWFIERGLDAGEYIAFDISVDGGNEWIPKGQLSGDVDQEDVWHQASFEVLGIDQLQLRFRGYMNFATEDANVDNVKIVVW